MVGQTYPK